MLLNDQLIVIVCGENMKPAKPVAFKLENENSTSLEQFTPVSISTDL